MPPLFCTQIQAICRYSLSSGWKRLGWRSEMLLVCFEAPHREFTLTQALFPVDEFRACLLSKTFSIGCSKSIRPDGLSTMLNWLVIHTSEPRMECTKPAMTHEQQADLVALIASSLFAV